MRPSRPASVGKMARIAAAPYRVETHVYNQSDSSGSTSQANTSATSGSNFVIVESDRSSAKAAAPMRGLGPPGRGRPSDVPPQTQIVRREGSRAPLGPRGDRQRDAAPTMMEPGQTHPPPPHHHTENVHGSEFSADGNSTYAQQNNAQYNDHRLQYLQQTLQVAMTSTDPPVRGF